MNLLPTNHITFMSCTEISDICKPFFEHSALTYYNFVRINDAGERICLSNNRAWMEYVFSNLDTHDITFESTPAHGKDHYIIWDNIETIGVNSLMTEARETFNIAHGFTIISNYTDYIEYHYFGADKTNKSINNYYINNLDELNQFILYFKAAAFNIIKRAEKEYINIENDKFWLKNGRSTRKEMFAKPALKLNRFYLSGKHKSVYLTRREAECLTCISDGDSAKAAAKNLRIDPRTVEKHIASIKNKLNCISKNDLIKSANESGFSQIASVLREQIKG
jgi:DNA-binding CsgD family transcriptional regulator